MLLALPYFEESRKFSISLPNAWNISFDFAAFLKIYMIAILPGKIYMI